MEMEGADPIVRTKWPEVRETPLADQLLSRLRQLRLQRDRQEGFFATGETRDEYEKRIKETPEAWVSCGGSFLAESILPR